MKFNKTNKETVGKYGGRRKTGIRNGEANGVGKSIGKINPEILK